MTLMRGKNGDCAESCMQNSGFERGKNVQKTFNLQLMRVTKAGEKPGSCQKAMQKSAHDFCKRLACTFYACLDTHYSSHVIKKNT